MKKVACFLIIILLPVAVFGFGLLQQMGSVPASGGDGLIGTATHDGSIQCYTGYNYHDLFTTDTAGNISYGHIYNVSSSTGDTICLTICNASGTALAYGSAVASDNSWTNVTLNTTVVISAATTYYLSAQSDGITQFGLDAAGDEYYYDQDAYDCDGNIDVPTETTIDATTSDLSIIFNNSSGDPT